MGLSDYKGNPEVRKAVLKAFSGKRADNWQDVGTPDMVVHGMLDLIPGITGLLHCVLFNLEFLEGLVFYKGVAPENIMFMADNAAEAAVARGMYGVKTWELPGTVRDPFIILGMLRGKIGKAFYQGGDVPVTNKLCVGSNFPFQQEDGGHGRSAKPLYNEFVEATVKCLKPMFFTSIMPSRWMLGGKGLDKFRAWMLSGAPMEEGDTKKHFSKLMDFKSATEVFEAEIAGGVCYFLWERDKHSPSCMYTSGKEVTGGKPRKLDEFDVFIRDNVGVDILNKVLYHHQGVFMDTIVSASKPYGFRADTTPLASGIPCWFKQSVGKKFVDPAIVKDPRGDLAKWKVLAPRAPIAGQTDFNKPISFFSEHSLVVAAPGDCCTETYVVLNSFGTEDEAKNFKAYVLTRFFRFQLLLRMVSQDCASDRYAWVPDLGSYTTAPTDDQLFAQFGLSPEEIEHIKRRVK